MAASVAIIVSGHGSLAEAGSTDHDQSLQSRIDDLEQQLRQVERSKAELESRLNHLEASLATLVPDAKKQSPHRRASASSVAAVTRPAPRHPVQTASADTAHSLDVAPAASQSASDVPTAPVSQAASPASSQPASNGDTDNAPQELNVLRENSVTLKPRGIEISTELDYLRNETQLQNDRALLTTTSIRYGLLNWLELSATIPTGYSVRTTDVGAAQSVTQRVHGVGDISFQANARVHDQTVNWPGIVVSLGLITPTGPSPYDFTKYTFNSAFGVPTPNPRNPLAYYFSQGTWGIHSNIQFYKTVDPLILFFGFGPDHLFPVNDAGFTVGGYNRLNYNLGFSFALSEKTTLGFSLTGSYYPDLKVDGRDVFQSSGEPTVVRLSLIQRIMKGVYLEPSASFGLDQDSPDFILGLGFRARL